MKNVALIMGLVIIIGGVVWYSFNSPPTAEVPALNQDNGETGGQIDPPSMDVDAGPADDNVDSSLPEVDDEVLVGSFTDCVVAGNPVMESYPRQCRHDGVLYVEEIEDDQLVACTADAKICPDGTGVGRIGPNCEFAPCPGEEPASNNSEAIVCTPESRLPQECHEDYTPVCGLTEVQCIISPCPPIEKTYSNGCFACASGNVISYTSGECS